MPAYRLPLLIHKIHFQIIQIGRPLHTIESIISYKVELVSKNLPAASKNGHIEHRQCLDTNDMKGFI